MSDWPTRSLEFDQRALIWKLSDFEVPSLCGNLYLQLGCVAVSFWVYHKTYTSKLLHCSTLQDLHYLFFQSFCIEPVSCVQSIPALLVSGDSF